MLRLIETFPQTQDDNTGEFSYSEFSIRRHEVEDEIVYAVMYFPPDPKWKFEQKPVEGTFGFRDTETGKETEVLDAELNLNKESSTDSKPMTVVIRRDNPIEEIENHLTDGRLDVMDQLPYEQYL
ncbi:hypothetical protein [Haloarcula mannanilytica]|uniref:hypothetical protein n=1 Tax=Haloarcula mannanilytica TaxID=2509225 RepID=UPI0010F434C5|nr:hypothetical protein [Haloarcula mannanilytica]